MSVGLTLIVLIFEVIVLVGWGGWVPTAPMYARGGSLALFLLVIATFVLWLLGKV